MSTSYIWYVAGCSGGHILPALSHARRFSRNNPYHKMMFFSAHMDLDHKLVGKARYIDAHVPLYGCRLPSFFSWRVVPWAVSFAWSFCKAFWNLVRYRPNKVVSMGGLVSLPVCCSAWLLRIPFEIYELNVEPGRAVTALSPFAETTYICFPQTRAKLPEGVRVVHSAYPLRDTARRRVSQEKARQALGISLEKRVICIVGGSQGSQFLNTFVMRNLLPHVSPQEYAFIHQAGPLGQGVGRSYRDAGYEACVFDYREDMHVCFAAADVVITRGGAGALFELAFLGRKSIVVPLERSVDMHQLHNARAMCDRYPDQFRVCRQSDLEEQPELMSRSLFELRHDWLCDRERGQ